MSTLILSLWPLNWLVPQKMTPKERQLPQMETQSKSGRWKKDCYKLKSKHLQPSKNRQPNPPQGCDSEDTQGLFPVRPLNSLGKILLQIRDKFLIVLIGTGAALSAPSLTTAKQFLPHSITYIPIVGTSRCNTSLFPSPYLFVWGLCKTNTHFSSAVWLLYMY